MEQPVLLVTFEKLENLISASNSQLVKTGWWSVYNGCWGGMLLYRIWFIVVVDSEGWTLWQFCILRERLLSESRSESQRGLRECWKEILLWRIFVKSVLLQQSFDWQPAFLVKLVWMLILHILRWIFRLLAVYVLRLVDSAGLDINALYKEMDLSGVLYSLLPCTSPLHRNIQYSWRGKSDCMTPLDKDCFCCVRCWTGWNHLFCKIEQTTNYVCFNLTLK